MSEANPSASAHTKKLGFRAWRLNIGLRPMSIDGSRA